MITCRNVLDREKYNLKNHFEMESRSGFSEVELQYLGIKEADSTEVTFTFEKDTGEQFELIVPAVSLVTSSDIKVASMGDKTALPFGEKVYEESGYAPFTYRIDTENRAVYFQYNNCEDSSSLGEDSGLPNFSDFMDEMVTRS